MVHQTLSCVFASFVIIFALIILIINIRLARALRKFKHSEKTLKIRKVISKAKHAIKNGLLTPTELIVLADEAMMSLEQVRQTYVREHVEPAKTLENIFGGVKNEFFTKFAIFSRFLEVGMAYESIFLKMSPIIDPSLKLCPTQSYSVERSDRDAK